MALEPDFGVFPLGTHVYREPHQDQEELLADLPRLKHLGFNMIKIQESWAIDEPAEGEYDFTRIEHVIGRAQELGLGVYLGLTMEQAPAWFWQKHPNCFLVYANGLPHNDPTQYCLPADAKPGPCWDHPEVRAAGERFIGALAQRLGAFGNIWAWNTWQEIGFWPNEGGVLGFCYCSHTIAHFQEWLKEKYRTLDNLNQRWASAYSSWNAIDPPRRGTSTPPFIDWRYFMDDVYLADALRWKTEALKKHDPGHRPVFSHIAGPQLGSGAEWRWARTGDFFGNSNYPAWHCFDPWDDDTATKEAWYPTAMQEMWNGIMLRADYTRSANGRDRAFWGAEFQGGPISTHLHLGRTPTADDIRRWMLAGLASGMHGISFWNHRAELFWQECNGFGLLDPEGETSERIEEAGRIGNAVNHWPALFAQGQPPRGTVALLVNEALFHFAQGSQNQAHGSQHQMLRLLAYNLRGHYARLWRLGVPVDFVEAEQVAAGALAGYAATILPMPLALADELFARLRTYVANGGTLISEACPGRFDAYGFCPRSQMVKGGEAVFGAQHHSLKLVRERGKHKWSPEPRGYGEIDPPTILLGQGDYDGEQLGANFYLQTLSPTTGEAILRCDEHDVAAVRHRYGDGMAILLGTFTGLSATADLDQDADRFIVQLLRQEAGVSPDRCGDLLRRRRIWGDQQAWFFINPLDRTVTAEVDLEHFTSACDLLGDEVATSSINRCSLTVPAASIRCLLVSALAGAAQ